MNPSPTPVLDLLRDPKHWTTGACARDVNGYATESAGPDAVCWCLMGALYKCRLTIEARWSAEAKLNAAVRERKSNHYVNFNNAPTTTHADIVALLEEVQI